MRYMGGKWRLRNRIADVLHQFPNERYLEPFVGSAAVLSVVTFNQRTASDTHKSLVSMYKALQAGWQPPTELSDVEYKHLKARRNEIDPLVSFAGFGCSFAGRYFEGYARNGRKTNCAQEAANSLNKIRSHIETVSFLACDYREHLPHSATVYCDPPYLSTQHYSGTLPFNHAEFWETMRAWSVDNDVIISEYVAPNDFECIAEFPTKLGLRTSSGQNDRIERLFKWKYK